MFRKSNISKTLKEKKSLKDLGNRVAGRIKGMRFRFLLILLIMSLIPLFLIDGIIHIYYRKSIVDSETIQLQTKSAVIAGEFDKFESLEDAKRAGMYNQMVKYSALNSVRIRIINTDFVIKSDSYSMENGKSIVNSKVINAYNTGKSSSGYDKTNTTIEAVTPILSKDGALMGILIMNLDMSEVVSFENMVYDKTNLIIIAVAFLVIIIALSISRVFGSSFDEMFKTVEQIANGHNEKRLVEDKGYTELKHFARNFNTIMDKANTLDETRQEFVSNVSHELKTPITSIKVLADSINMQEDVPIEIYKEFMHDITEEIDRESKIIEDLLSLVRMDKSTAVLNIAPVNINELLEIVLKRLKPIAQKKNIEILFESFRPVVAEVDEVKITQVISNLVENAIKYNKIDGSVHVSLNADYKYFYIRVEDTGIGIPKESQDMIFERFYRVDKARSRETGGTGLGLAIVKSIVLMHHGTIKLHSEEDLGTTFTVRIPLNYIEQV